MQMQTMYMCVETLIYRCSPQMVLAFTWCFFLMTAGGLKLWEGSIDLIKALSSDMQDGKLSFGGKRILEVGH